MVHNYMETLVTNALNSEFRDNPEKYVDVCHCPSCVAIIKAQALNYLAPFYVTGTAGEVYGEYRSKDLQRLSDVMVALGKGIEVLNTLDVHGKGNAQAVPPAAP